MSCEVRLVCLPFYPQALTKKPRRPTALARQYEIAKTASVRPASVPSEKAHREQLASLDNSKYSLAKVIAGLESDLSALEAKLARKREEVKGFESEERVPEEGIAEV